MPASVLNVFGLSLMAYGLSKWRRVLFSALLLAAGTLEAQKRLVIIDQDAAGPGGTDQMSIIALLNAPSVQVLGITVVTGDQWRDEEVQHTLRMLELTGHTDVPVVPGAVFPLVRSQEETKLAASLYGQVGWLGAWGGVPSDPQHWPVHGPYEVSPLKEGAPHTKALDEDAAHFLVRQVRAHPHEITIYSAAPLTNIALAISLDPHFAEMTKGIVIMGGSLDPQSDDPEFSNEPRHEFNFWFDPEAAHIVLRAHWPRIDLTTVDVSVKAPFTKSILDQIARRGRQSASAQYIAKYSQATSFLWDELAACSLLDPTIITNSRELYMDVDLSHGPSYGNVLTWDKQSKPQRDLQLVHAQVDLDVPKFTEMFVELVGGGNKQ